MKSYRPDQPGMTNPETNDLWLRFKNGDENALSELYNCYVHKLFSYGLKISGDEFLVKDCIQDVFIRLIDQRKDFIMQEDTSLYLFKSLRNKIFEELRSKNRRVDIAGSIVSDELNHEISPEQVTVSNEEEQYQTRTLDRAMSKLSDYQKEAIFLKYSQGLGYEKIAELLGIDIASARTLIYRSLKKLKESIYKTSQVLLLFFRLTSK